MAHGKASNVDEETPCPPLPGLQGRGPGARRPCRHQCCPREPGLQPSQLSQWRTKAQRRQRASAREQALANVNARLKRPLAEMSEELEITKNLRRKLPRAWSEARLQPSASSGIQHPAHVQACSESLAAARRSVPETPPAGVSRPASGPGLPAREGLRAKAARKFKATTNSRPSLPVAVNLLEPDFTAMASCQRRVGDATYLSTGEG